MDAPTFRIETATPEDHAAWLRLAREVEPLFGAAMAGDAIFHASLERQIARGTALCVRENSGPPGAPLAAGMFWRNRHPEYRIVWLAVAVAHRRHGVGRALVRFALSTVVGSGEVSVVTFCEGHPGGEPARAFYTSLGFRPSELLDPEEYGSCRQVFRLTLL